jgi:GT2 family glycosyltransferase
LDADDLWHVDFLKEMVRLINDYPGKSIYGLGCSQINRGDKSEFANDYYRGIAEWNYDTMAFTGSSACINREDAIKVGLFDTCLTHGEDIDMWWRLMLLNGGASNMKPYAFYIQDAENRAMHRIIPLEKHIPYYIDKFAEARAANVDFRRFFDQEMIYRLYPYLFDRQYCSEARRLAEKLDYSLQKKSMKWRMQWPYVYKLYLIFVRTNKKEV